MSSKTKSSATKDEATPALVPKLRFPEFRVAKGWTGEKLGAKTKKVGSGITPTGGDKNYKPSGRPFVRSQNIGWGELLLDDVAFIDEETHNSFSSTQIAVYDVLLNITGASIGRSVVADSRIEGGNVNQHVCIIRVKPDELSPFFLNQYLISHDGQKQIDSFQAGGNRQGLNFEQIRSFLIPLPAVFAEQQKIAECLSSVDELMAAQARKVDALKTHKKGLMQQLFPREGETQPRLRFPEFQNVGGWVVKPLGEVFQITSSKRVHESDWTPTGVPFYRAREIVALSKREPIQPLFISEELYAAYCKQTGEIREGHLLVTGVGSIGVPYLVKAGDRFYFKDGNIIWLKNEGRELSGEFLHRLYETDYVQKQLKAMADVGTVATYTIDNAKRTLAAFPKDKREQQRIATCLSSLDALITAETQKHEALKTHKKGLMQQLFPSPEEG